MNYLFFDTESANCYGNLYKMCEWGSLITDESFNVLPRTKKDILINPGRDGKFNLVGRKDGRDLILAHSESEYRAADLFFKFYDNIKFLLTQKDTMIFLWASENDIKALLDQCQRYRFPKYSFVSYDVQALFMKAFPEIGKTPSLENAIEFLGVSLEGITAHRPDDDAFMTSLVLKGMCEKTGKTVKELIEESPKCKMESVSTYIEMEKNHKKKMERKRLSDARKKELAPYNAELNALFDEPRKLDADWNKGFSISLEMKKHIDETLDKIKLWIERGFGIKRSLTVPHLVYYSEEEKGKLSSQLDLTELKLVSIDEFDKITQAK